MRDGISEPTEVRWEVLKSMLDDFPQLVDRTEKYISYKKSRTYKNTADHVNSDTKKLLHKAVKTYQKERLQR